MTSGAGSVYARIVLIVTACCVMASRHGAPLSEKQMKEYLMPYVPENTQLANQWGIKLFYDWINERNSRPDCNKKCPVDILDNKDTPIEDVDFWLALFVMEVRRSDGMVYSGSSLRNIVSALGRRLKAVRGDSGLRILEKSCGEFVKTRNALDRMLRVLRESGVGAERKRSDIFTPELENRLWSTQV